MNGFLFRNRWYRAILGPVDSPEFPDHLGFYPGFVLSPGIHPLREIIGKEEPPPIGDIQSP